MSGPDVDHWRGAGASVPGYHHGRDPEKCQDAWCCLTRREVLIAVVCDGAGTSANARFAAHFTSRKTACQLRRLIPTVRTFQDRFAIPDIPTPDDQYAEQPFNKLIADVLDDVRNELVRHADSLKAPHADYRSTVIGVVAGNSDGIIFQVGDGACAAALLRNDTAESTVVSSPDNGLDASETYFLIDSDWRDHLRFTIFYEKNLVLLASDGAAPFVFSDGYRSLEPDFVSPVCRHLKRFSGRVGRSKSLSAILAHPDAEKTASGHDDKTLVWAQLMPTPDRSE